MIGVSLSHGQDPWTSKQKTVHLSLHKVLLHLHVGPQQQGEGGVHIEQRSKQHVKSAQQTIISPRHPILGGRTIAALQQQQPETSVSMLQHPIASEKRWSSQDPCSRGDHTTEDLSTPVDPPGIRAKVPKQVLNICQVIYSVSKWFREHETDKTSRARASQRKP